MAFRVGITSDFRGPDGTIAHADAGLRALDAAGLEWRFLAAGCYDDWHEGRDPAGILTQDDALSSRLDPELGGRRLANYLRTMVLETQPLARVRQVARAQPRAGGPRCADDPGGGDARVPLAGTNCVPGRE